MRRKRLAELHPDVAALLAPNALKPAPVDDPLMPYPLRKKDYERWMDRRSAWVDLREQYAREHGWPGGEYARQVEEMESHPIPDAPFDPEWEMQHGDL